MASETGDDDPLIGQSLSDRYQVLRKLGEGGMGAVYEAEHTLIRKRVAVKVLHPEYSRDAEVVSRFHREALAATGIGNEHIVEVNDMGRLAAGGLYMVLELLAGRDFAQLLDEEGPLSVGRAVRIVRQLCDGLSAAHAKGIVHRDLKPENVFLITRHGDPEFVKILDFGISKIMSVEGEPDARAKTKTGTIIGTALYMPPEQARGLRDVDHRADIYALGVILYRALSLAYPFQAETYVDVVLKICTDDPEPLSEHRPDLPPALYAVVDRCLSKDRSARYQTCAELSSALAPFEKLDDAAPQRARVLAQDVDVSGATMQAPAVAIPKAIDVDADTRLPAFEVVPTPVIREAVAALPTDSVARHEEAIAAPRRGPLIVAITAGLATLVGIGGWVSTWGPADSRTLDAPSIAARTSQTNPREPNPPEPNLPEPNSPEPNLPEPAEAQVLVHAPDPPSAATVAVHITTAPVRDAQLLLDGLPIANPFHGSLPESRELHRLEASAPGYRTHIRSIALLYPQEIAITLRRGSGTEVRGAPPSAAQAPVAAREPTPPPALDPEPPVREPSPEPPPTVVVPPPRAALKRLIGQ